MDFIKIFPNEINDLIMLHLRRPDILQASLVSKDWYTYIANSKSCMMKLLLYYSGQLDKDINPLLNSTRRYRCMKFSCDDNYFTKTRRIENIFRLILNKFSDSIEGLQTSHDTKRVSLPKLKKFLITSKANQVAIHPNGIFSTSTNNIERLAFMCSLDEKSVENVIKFLQNMTKLKALIGNFHYFLPNWKSWFKHQFSLQEVWRYPPRPIINEFLLEHRLTLEIVRLRSTENLEFMLTNFPRLHTIIISQLSPRITQEFSFNETVSTLIILSFSEPNPDYSITCVLSKLKNLKVLQVSYLSFEVFIAIFSLRSTLKILIFNNFENTAIMYVGLRTLARSIKVKQIVYRPI